jgi:hypothetical protein
MARLGAQGFGGRLEAAEGLEAMNLIQPKLHCLRCGKSASEGWNRNHDGLCTRIISIGGGAHSVECQGELQFRPRAALAEENPDALWPDGFDGAYVGQARRCGQPTLAAFSVAKCIKILMDRDGMSYAEADEFFEFNVAGAWSGVGTPIWIYDLNEG